MTMAEVQAEAVRERGRREREDGYSPPTVCKLTGATIRQLDYWVREGVITPSISTAAGSGTRRRYSAEDVRILRHIRRLMDVGVGLQRVRGALSLLRDPDAGRWLYVQDGAVGTCSDEALAEVLANQATVIIDMKEVTPIDAAPCT